MKAIVNNPDKMPLMMRVKGKSLSPKKATPKVRIIARHTKQMPEVGQAYLERSRLVREEIARGEFTRVSSREELHAFLDSL